LSLDGVRFGERRFLQRALNVTLQRPGVPAGAIAKM
jgi:hypothetical protein